MKNMATDPAAWFWQYCTQTFTLNTVRSLMDSFALEPCMLASNSEFDLEPLLVTSEFGEEDDFSAAIEKVLALDEPSEDKMPQVELDIAVDARKQLISTFKENDNLDFDKDRDVSRRTGFGGSVGNSMARKHKKTRKRYNEKVR